VAGDEAGPTGHENPSIRLRHKNVWSEV